MKTITYNKLVRDKIPKKIEKSGDSCKIEVLTGKRKLTHMKRKLKEEIKEFLEAEAPSKKLYEAADVIIALQCLTEDLGVKWKSILEYHNKHPYRIGDVQKNLKEGSQILSKANMDHNLVLGAWKVYGAVKSILHSLAMPKKTLMMEIKANLEEKGGFDEGYFLVSTTSKN